jgi:malonyl-CoA decarboxylase
VNRFERMLRHVRGWRGAGGVPALVVSADLGPDDLRVLRPVIDDCISGRGGEVAARRRATSVAAAFAHLGPTGQRRFFDLLAHSYGADRPAVDAALLALGTVTGEAGSDIANSEPGGERQRLEAELRRALVPRRERLFRRFLGLEGGLPFLVSLREALLDVRHGDPALGALDAELRDLLEGWFDVALLRLERLTWQSPAALLERLIEYEAVHAITSWDDLRGRMGPARRCYAFLHPAMPDDPLIFVEIALTRGVATTLAPLLDHEAARADDEEPDTAVFYSISNAHRGLAGVSLGDFLIKQVVERLRAELPGIRRFVTLSPVPGFRSWLEAAVAEGRAPLGPGERAHLCPDDPALAEERLLAAVATDHWISDARREHLRPVLERACAHYLLGAKRDGRAADPVAHFHLSNGASVDRIDWLADPGRQGLRRSFGMMVNYRYALEHIEANHDRYVLQGEIRASGTVRDLLEPMPAPRARPVEPGRPSPR